MTDHTTRKVQQVGGTTLTVSLPKEWTDVMGLEAGDEVRIAQNDDGSLQVQPPKDHDTETTTCTIDIDSCDSALLARCIVGGYILGYETLELQAETAIEHDTINTVHRTMRRLNGMSIVEQEETRIVLRNFMDVSSSSIYVIMRRLSKTVLHMLDSSLYAFLQQREDLIDEVTEMEDDVDVLYWLILRQLLSAIEDRAMMDDIGVESPLHIVGNRTAIKSLEGMADCIEAIGEAIRQLIEEESLELTQRQQEQLSTISEYTHEQIEQAVSSLIDQDVEAAHQVLENRDRFNGLQERFLDSFSQQDATTRIAVNRILWNIERIVEYSAFIAEITINRTMEAESGATRITRPDEDGNV